MEELDYKELREINGGWIRLLCWLAGGLAYEMVTEGIEQCINDFKEGFESTQKK